MQNFFLASASSLPLSLIHMSQCIDQIIQLMATAAVVGGGGGGQQSTHSPTHLGGIVHLSPPQ